METNKRKAIEKIFNKTVSSNQIHECVLLVENSNGDFSYSNGCGGKKTHSPLIMASVTKLLTTTCILFLQEQGRLAIEDKVSDYLDDTIMDSLHIYNGKEYSYELTISDLLFQRSVGAFWFNRFICFLLSLKRYVFRRRC